MFYDAGCWMKYIEHFCQQWLRYIHLYNRLLIFVNPDFWDFDLS